MPRKFASVPKYPSTTHSTPLRAQKARFCARNAQNPGKTAHSDTKTSILCSKAPKLGVPKAKSAQNCRFCARNALKLGFRRPKKHKNLDFVLEMPENGGSRGQKSTKNPILCSKRLKIGVPEAKSAQKCRFCAREERELASGNITAETLTVNVAFLQITARVSKM